MRNEPHPDSCGELERPGTFPLAVGIGVMFNHHILISVILLAASIDTSNKLSLHVFESTHVASISRSVCIRHVYHPLSFEIGMRKDPHPD